MISVSIEAFLLLLYFTGKRRGYPVRLCSAQASQPSGKTASHFCVMIFSNFTSAFSSASQRGETLQRAAIQLEGV